MTINTAVLPTVPHSFDLLDGGSETFNFFKIWTPESDVGSDDTTPKQISATLNFSVPSISGTVDGNTVGESQWVLVHIWGALWLPKQEQLGQVTWGSPVQVTAADRIFEISLSSEIFNKGLFGLDEGRCDGALVQATITQIRETPEEIPSVPDGGTTVSLLGFGLIGLLGIHRRLAIAQ